MKVKLVSNDMWSPALEFAVEAFPSVIGCNGKSDIQVSDRWMSDQHCELFQVDGELNVRDLRSQHGTLVNGEPVSHAVLNSGDTLTIGIRSFRVSYRRRQRTNSANGKKKQGSQQPVQAAGAVAS